MQQVSQWVSCTSTFDWSIAHSMHLRTVLFRVELGFCKVSNIREKQEARDLILNTQTYS